MIDDSYTESFTGSKKDKIISKYLAYLILHPVVQKRLLSKSKGSTVQHINMKDIRKLSFGVIPSLAKQSEDIEVIEKVSIYTAKMENKYRRKIEALQELKQSIIEKALTGKLTI